jgi:di/tripeptidase
MVTITEGLAAVLEQLPRIREEVQAARETLLANLVMIGEIPSPTFGEQARLQFLRDRFAECHLEHISTDEADNCVGILPGSQGSRNILLVAHADTVFPATEDHTIRLDSDRVVGPAVGDNSLGLATLATLPTLLQRLNITLDSNLVLMGASRSLGHGDLGGLRFFLDHTSTPIHAGVCVEGVQLGRLAYASLGMRRVQLLVNVPEEYDWTRFGASSAIPIINEAINRINAIPLSRRPRTNIVWGALHAGASYNTMASSAELRLEIRSESADVVGQIQEHIEEIAEELSAETHADVVVNIVSRREPGGIRFGHPLVRNVRRIMEALDVEPRIGPSMSELASFIYRDIPAVTVGITTGEHHDTAEETVFIEPMFTGLAQLIAILLTIDKGLCDED